VPFAGLAGKGRPYAKKSEYQNADGHATRGLEAMSDKSRFLNFPIVMLAETIADPKRGLNAIACFAFAGYAKHCGRDFPAAFAQVAYLARSQGMPCRGG
jgi:hypothetical protein